MTTLVAFFTLAAVAVVSAALALCLAWRVWRRRAAEHHVAGHVRGYADGWNAATLERSRLEYVARLRMGARTGRERTALVN